MYKVSTVDWGYCKPRHLDAVVNDFRIQAGNRKTNIIKMYEDFLPSADCLRWACIGIKRCKTEYKVILNYYRRA